ncbi:ArnT family glycosyltransferase [Thiobacter aerophilum]|uniref:Glycosyltransferase RgtA/B/C/D-like domain-containing protein n=1 Tax=Thiobacter aerophilum TaxID=3121275 RepID=A0ABV0EEZ0_9BURK
MRQTGTPVSATGRAEQSEASKLILLLLLTCAWLLPGLVGHDPWKPRDAVTFGVVHHMLISGDWLVPAIAGETTFEHGPFYYWVAALLARLLAGWLPLHDAARLASGLFVAASFLALGYAGRLLMGPGLGRPTVVVLLGCVGLITNGHEMQPDTAVLAGYALALAGFALLAQGRLSGGVLLGQGLGMAFLASGPTPVVVLGLTALLLPFFPQWRSRTYGRGLVLAGFASLPWLAIWPALIARRAPEWLHRFWQESGRGLIEFSFGHFPGQLAYYAELLTWFAWPALPLAVWTLLGYRRKLLVEPRYQLPLVFFGVVLGVLSGMPQRSDTLALPLLLPLALLAAAGIDTLRRGAANALGWFGIMGFGAAALFLWVAWLALMTGVPARFASHLLELVPGYVPRFSWTPFLVALLLTFFWLLPLRRSFRSGRRAAVNWAAGITLFWGLLATLWLPWLDHGRSYARPFLDLKAHLPAHYTCIAGAGLSDAHRALLYYYAGLRVRRVEDFEGMECDLFLLQWNPRTPETRPGPGWVRLWEGGRPGEKRERFRLLRFEGGINERS